MGWRSKTDSGRPAAQDSIENVLGRSLLIRGDLSADGAFRIDGEVQGSVDSRSAVVIGESGVVRGNVRGSDVVVAGQIIGNVCCTGHLEIRAKGKICGEIDAQSVRVETGGVFRGTSRMGQAEASDAAHAAPLDGDVEPEPALSNGHLSPVT
jgi:cytoskeletal protein CcmA (bactofilin family)